MCECVKELDAALEPSNARIAMAFQIDKLSLDVRARIMVATEKIDKSKRKPLPAVVASFCPFCGEKA